MRKKAINLLLVILGTISLILGIIGIFLPLLPTTPFLLAAAYCYARSSKKLYYFLMHNSWFSEYLRNYKEGKGITLYHKIATLFLLWLAIGFSMIFVVSSIWIRIVLLVIALAVTVHVVLIKTFKNKAVKKKAKTIFLEKSKKLTDY